MACAHDHDGHGHGHIHGSTNGPRLLASLGVTIAFVIGEGIAGYRANSLSLLSDAGHNAGDALALGLAAYAIWVAKKPANKNNTYGYHRVAILTALFNAVTLAVISLVILLEAGRLLLRPEPVVGSLMVWVALASVFLNTVIALALRGGSTDSLNMRAAYIHMAGDAGSAVAVVVAGLVVQRTGWVYADPAVSVLIAAFILYTAWGIVRDSTNILLEASPKGLDVDRMVEAMCGVPAVLAVHDVHVWTVSDGMNYLSCHVELPTGCSIEDSSAVVQTLSELLARDFRVAHATIQTEVEGTCHTDVTDARFCDPTRVKRRHPEYP
ncbi:MAG: cation diffusion facilitator family transporter [Fimbriimonadaceae bacterium]